MGENVLYGANTLTLNRPIGDTGLTWSMPIGGAVLLEIATTYLLVSVVFAVARLRIGMHVPRTTKMNSNLYFSRPKTIW